MVQCDRDGILYNCTGPLFSTYLSQKWGVVDNPTLQIKHGEPSCLITDAGVVD